ncbi:SusD/RagB family nutrient-binding outer membrane lipoprotein [Hymenobacter terrigena]
MKPALKLLAAGAFALAVGGCSKFIDINDNPNAPTVVKPDALLAQALAITAANYSGGQGAIAPNNQNYNSYASFAADYWGKSGVVSGFGEERTYNYSSSYYGNLFSFTYDNLNDYNIIQQQGTAQGYPFHAAIARIMKVYNFQLLVDEYGDIPYSQALQAASNVTPTYDKADAIYKDFIVQLDGAIDDINKATAAPGSQPVGAEDIVFGGNMTKWKQFANSLKLRVLLRESQVPALDSYVRTEMARLQAAPDGFIDADVVVQPGYTQSTNQQNPLWNRYGLTPSGSNTTERSYQIPTNYIIAQYVDNNDPRVSQLYALGSRTVNGVTTNTYVGTDAGESGPPSFNGNLVASRFLLNGGILKGFNAPTPLMLLAEHLFSKAEAESRGLFAGGDAAAKADFLNGIKASFVYFYRSATGSVNPLASSTAGVAEYNTYIAANAANPLVNYDLTPSSGALGKQSVIIYQKYLAMNSVASTEAWDDYRRTAQPKIQPSLESASPRPDKLPTRLLYPLSEVSTNAANIPANVDQYTKIFWDVVD